MQHSAQAIEGVKKACSMARKWPVRCKANGSWACTKKLQCGHLHAGQAGAHLMKVHPAVQQLEALKS